MSYSYGWFHGNMVICGFFLHIYKRLDAIQSAAGQAVNCKCSKIYWYANLIPLQVRFSHKCGGSLSEKPVGRSLEQLNEPNACSKADAK